jgi:hypothetical protein
MKMKQLLLPVIALCMTAGSQAAVLAQYTFATNLSATTTALNVTAGDFSQAPAAGATIGYSGSGNIFQRSNNTSSTEATALTNTEYHTVTISAAPGFSLSLSDVTFFLGHTTDNNTSFTSTAVLSSSVDSFATAITGTGGISRTTAVTTSSAYNASAASFDLSGAAYQGLASITFRLTVFDNLNENGKLTRLDNFTLNGDVIPEPSSALLGGLGMLLLLRRRR